MIREFDDIYKMELHEETWNESGQGIKRVAGGWIYMTTPPDSDEITSQVFVPFSNEFDPNKPVHKPLVPATPSNKVGART